MDAVKKIVTRMAAKAAAFTGRAQFSKNFHRSSDGRAAQALVIERIAASPRHRSSLIWNAAWRIPVGGACARHAASMASGTKTPWFP